MGISRFTSYSGVKTLQERTGERHPVQLMAVVGGWLGQELQVLWLAVCDVLTSSGAVRCSTRHKVLEASGVAQKKPEHK